MHKNCELIGNVSAIGSNMEGIVRIDGFICFVPYALLGEKIKFRVLKVTKNMAFCKLIEVLTPAEERVRPRCRVFGKCGGCQLQHLKYKEQLKHKTTLVSDCLKKIAGVEFKVLPCIKSEYEFEYRNKLQLPVRATANGNKIGFFAENSHRIVEIDDCPIQNAWVKDVISAFKEYLEISGVSCYNEETGEGLLRHIVARQVGMAIIFVAVVNGTSLLRSDVLISCLIKKFKKFSLFVNFNTQNNNVILGSEYKLLFGEPYFEIDEFSIKYPVYPMSFMQVNQAVKRKLYLDAVKAVSADENTTVIDAYSGAGLMTALFARSAKKVIGIEAVKEAVDSANVLVKKNGLTDKVVNHCALCEDKLPQVISEERLENNPVTVVLDPPRKGCDKKVLQALLDAKPEKIVYISCSPQTLSRDLGILIGTLVYDGNEIKRAGDSNGTYKIERVQPYDMFPQTKHVETLVCLCKKA